MARYYECDVSTCNNKRTGLVFCSVECWDAHLPILRHRSAGSIESRAPKSVEEAMNPAPVVKKEVQAMTVNDLEKEVLIVASKLKAYIKAKSDMNMSANVLDILSDRVRNLADDAIAKARADGRKTVMDRDF